MKLAIFTQSILSDWNHGSAHFLRGVASELIARGHPVRVFEPDGGWSLNSLVRERGDAPIHEFHDAYPLLCSHRYGPDLDLEWALDGVDVILVHEDNEPDLVARIGEHRARDRHSRLLFHDTSHRAVTAPDQMRNYDLSHYDGILASGAALRDLYLERDWAARAWTWHQAADTRVFFPRLGRPRADLIWVGNWGEGERREELGEFLLDPVVELGLQATAYGVHYPKAARAALICAGIEYRGWLPNYRVPEAFARHRVTVHVPRRPYVDALPGVAGIRPFEALACGIPLVSSPWWDSEGLFTPGEDFLVAADGGEMRDHIRDVLNDRELAGELAARGRATILERHTCVHRVDELLGIVAELGAGTERRTATA